MTDQTPTPESHVIVFLKEKEMITVDGVLYRKSRRRKKTEEEKQVFRAKRKVYMKARRMKIRAERQELKRLKKQSQEKITTNSVRDLPTLL